MTATLPWTAELHLAALARGREVVALEAAALAALGECLDLDFARACEMIVTGRRQLVVTGMGKSGHVARKGAATFAATGTPAVYIHPGEAAHGDLGMLCAGDVLMVVSNSGNTAELKSVLAYARATVVPIIGVASNENSLVIAESDVGLILPPMPEACTLSMAPTTSTAMQLALLDAMAMAVMQMRGISVTQVRALHPAGAIGLALMPVGEIMHSDERLPLVPADARMPAAISVMTTGCFGLVGVVDQAGCLLGVITDGDLRRHFEVLATATAREVMTSAPKVLAADMLAGDALEFLNHNQITAAFVVDGAHAAARQPLGIVHIHDLLRQGLG